MQHRAGRGAGGHSGDRAGHRSMKGRIVGEAHRSAAPMFLGNGPVEVPLAEGWRLQQQSGGWFCLTGELSILGVP